MMPRLRSVSGQRQASTRTYAARRLTPSPASCDTFASGTEAFSAFQADASLNVKYMSVAGTVSVSAAVSKMFKKVYSYAFFNCSANLISASIKKWANHIDEPTLKRQFGSLGHFDIKKPDLNVVKAYRSFFRAAGSHAVTGCNYGGRFQLVSAFIHTSSK